MSQTYKKNYLQLSLVTLVFVIPIVVSIVLFHYHERFPLKTLNHGQLLQPPIDAQYLYSKTQDGNKKKWRIIYVAGDYCNASCQTIDHQLHQLQKALGKDSDRVMILSLNNKNNQMEKLKNALSKQEKTHFIISDKIYLLDPLGNLFMYYSSTANLMDVFNDLKRVLEVSQIG